MAHEESADSSLFALTVLTFFFLLLEISFFITCNKSYFLDFTYVSAEIAIPKTILPAITFFLVIEIALHAAYLAIIWYIASLIGRFSFIFNQYRTYISVMLWLIGIITILLANQYLYPNSKFASLTDIIFSNFLLLKISLFACLSVCAAFLLLATLQCFREHYIVLICSAITLLLYNYHQNTTLPTKDAATSTKPNIIIIGVDSLRPDFLHFFGADEVVPFFDNFLNNATVFSQALTPLARTFPSWTSLLTGKHPFHNGVRFNLTHPSRFHLSNTLPMLLKEQGFETAYATDETRFSNIDHYFGFDHIITPPMGLNDFLIGTFNDFPLSNLLINTKVGRYLFPYSYGNRGVYFTYEPQSFLNLLLPFLKTDRTKPLFLCIHFCLPHFPYTWGAADLSKLSPEEMYLASVKRVGDELQAFWQALKAENVLTHAIIVLISDHGEALALDGDRITERALFQGVPPAPLFYPPSVDGENMNQSAGHGTDVLGLSQYHTLLAFKFLGFKPYAFETVSDLVTLLDIKPTLQEMLGMKRLADDDGLSLVGRMSGEKENLPLRHIFIESDYSPASIRTIYPETREVVLEGVKLFEIDPETMRLSIRARMGKMIIESKQYADIYGEWMLAIYPQDKLTRLPILINLRSGEWTDDLSSSFAKNSPVVSMLLALETFYKQKLI